MKPVRTLALAAALLAAPSPPRAGLAFDPAPGTVLTKRFHTRFALEERDTTTTVNGVENPSGFELDLGTDTAGSHDVLVRDELLAVEGGRPLELRRTYVEVVLVREQEGRHPLESVAGRTVRFHWNGERQAYARELVGSDEEPPEEARAALEQLAEDMDLRALLPAGAVEEGASWRVPLLELQTLLVPGIDLEQRGDLAEGVEPAVLERFLGALGDAELVLTWSATREVDGRRLARVDAELSFAAAIDMADAMRSLFEAEESFGAEVGLCELAVDLAGAGELDWDLEAGHLHAFQMDVDGDLTVDMELSLEQQGVALDFDVHSDYSLTFERAVSLE